jgi:hypothetical protein
MTITVGETERSELKKAASAISHSLGLGYCVSAERLRRTSASAARLLATSKRKA